MDDDMMLDSPNSLVSFKETEVVAKWINSDEQDTVLMIVKAATDMLGDRHVSPRTFNTLKNLLASCPVAIDCQRPKSHTDLKALWEEVKSFDHPYALFLLGMWAPSVHTRQRSSKEEIAQILHEAFTGQFEGDAVDLFVQAMDAYVATFNAQIYYGKIIAWYGPSGAGKSKGIDALQDKFPTFTICFRDSDDPSGGWPPGDRPAYEFFKSESNSAPEERVAAFLGAFFEIAAEELRTAGVSPAESARASWQYKFEIGSTYGESARGVLFTRVAKRAQNLLSDTLPSKIDGEPEYRYRQLWNRYCEDRAVTLLNIMPTVPYCFIALDECTDIPNVKPIVLRRILQAGHHITKLWFILLGTNTKIQVLQPTASRTKPSARFRKLQCLPTWCYFSFGQLAPPEPDTPRKALEVDYLRKVGRPLFATYKTAAITYINATTKLFSPQSTFDPSNVVQVLTAFSHRILLQLGNTAVAHQVAADSVNSNLRYATRIDGEIVRTVCPSEPLLSLISSDVLNMGDNFVGSLATLVDAVKSATIDRGQEGELYCRLLIIRARDVACQRALGPGLARKLLRDDVEFKGPDCEAADTFAQASFAVRLITLEQHLDALVHLENFNDPSAALELRNFTKSYHVNITHMVRFDDVITAVRPPSIPSSAPVIDGFYVAYGGDLDQPFDLDKFMVIAWQSKAKAAAASQGELVASLTGPMQKDSAGKHYKPAQLVIIMDLNTKAVFKGKGNSCLEVTKRRASIPLKKNNTNQAPWGGYAASTDEEPLTWCLNIRGHTKASYPCIDAALYESSPPTFSALFDEVGPDIVANSMIAQASRSADACLQPLGSF
ncbi:hypothetical protein B0H17DRAFT_1175227 [Mycena rosella]|uniref:Uncharacterized protein n=1 Tax=Mycena rosella TaxID=1033263 RepID=A0AAD7GTZ1_MYCRO|nr:hypothetical protein B0H17DRAFT_1175227 [Mycena rosella]